MAKNANEESSLMYSYPINTPSEVVIYSLYHTSVAHLYSYRNVNMCGEGFFDTNPLQLPANYAFQNLSLNLNPYIYNFAFSIHF